MQIQSTQSNITPKLGVGVFFLLACAVTWAAAAPTAMAWRSGQAPSPLAVAGAGLSAFGPLIAVALVARRRGEVFGRWRTPLGWVALALAVPLGLRLLAALATAAAGGELSQWVYPPSAPERFAALLVFPLGEEFGWRGYAHPRLTRRHGYVVGSLILGLMWGAWHLAYGFTPDGQFDAAGLVEGMVELPLYSLILCWIFERSGRSMAVAIAFHAAAHLNHIELAPKSEVMFHGVHLLLVLVAALWVTLRWIPKLPSPAPGDQADALPSNEVARGR